MGVSMATGVAQKGSVCNRKSHWNRWFGILGVPHFRKPADREVGHLEASGMYMQMPSKPSGKDVSASFRELLYGITWGKPSGRFGVGVDSAGCSICFNQYMICRLYSEWVRLQKLTLSKLRLNRFNPIVVRKHFLRCSNVSQWVILFFSCRH